MTAAIKIRLLRSVSKLFASILVIACSGCATGLKCSSTSDVLSTLKLPADKSQVIRYSRDYPNYSGNYEATEITYSNSEYLEIPMAGAKCTIIIQAGKAVQATGCSEKLIGTFAVYRNACNFW